MPQPDSGYSLFGAIALVVVGLVIFIPSGLCTGVMSLGPLIQFYLHPPSQGNPLDILPMVLVIGGPFVVLGFTMIWNGVKRILAIKRRQGR
jgi:hypothetical protein